MPETVISPDVISVAVNEESKETSALGISSVVLLFLFYFAVMDSCFLYLMSVSQPICLFPPVQLNSCAFDEGCNQCMMVFLSL